MEYIGTIFTAVVTFILGYVLGRIKAERDIMKKARARFISNVLSGNNTKKMVELYSDEIPSEKNVVWAIIISKEQQKENGTQTQETKGELDSEG